jgi:hypothetical protein
MLTIRVNANIDIQWHDEGLWVINSYTHTQNTEKEVMRSNNLSFYNLLDNFEKNTNTFSL